MRHRRVGCASLQDSLCKGHLACFISDTVDALDLRAFYARNASGVANDQPFHPAEIERREIRLKAIVGARQRIEKRQRDTDIERGRSPDDECKPTDEDGKPTGGRFKREFDQPEPLAPEHFTDSALEPVVGCRLISVGR